MPFAYGPEVRRVHGIHSAHALRVSEAFPTRQIVDVGYATAQRPHIERVYLPPAATTRVQVSPRIAPDEVADVPLPSSRASVSDSQMFGSSYASTVFVPVAPSREKQGPPASQEHAAQHRLQELGLDLYQPITPRDGFRFPSAGKSCSSMKDVLSLSSDALECLMLAAFQ